MCSRFDTTTPPGLSSVTAKSTGAFTGSVARLGTTTSPVSESTSKTPPSTGYFSSRVLSKIQSWY